jgi:hypothetical protein
MALTATTTLEQNGKRFTANNTITATGTASDEGIMINFSDDFDASATRNPRQADFTAIKVTKAVVGVNTGAAAGLAFFSLEFDGAAVGDEAICSVPYGSSVPGSDQHVFDFSQVANGGIVDNKVTGFTGDILCKRTVNGTASADDQFTVWLEGELIP